MPRIVTQPPAEEAISIEQALPHLRIEADEVDAALDAWLQRGIQAVRQMAEGEMLRPLLPQTCVVAVDALGPRIRLWSDVTEVVSVQYRDADGVEQLLPLSQCSVERGKVLLVSGDIPVSSAVRVTFKCGAWPDPASVPAPIIQWMLLQLTALHEVRQSVTYGETFAVPNTFVRMLIDPYAAVEI